MLNMKHSHFRWVIWLLASAFFFYEFILRLSPSAMVNELMESYSINAAQVGTLSALYLLAYAPMQIPVGVLMDRLGARRLLTIAAAICGGGTLLFALASGVYIAGVGRMLMGLGSAFAFVGVVYTSSHWFSGRLLNVLIGIGNSLGMLGAVWGQGPLIIIVEDYGWRGAMVFLGLIGLILAALIFWAFRFGEPRVYHENEHAEKNVLAHVAAIVKNGETWLNGLISVLLYATTSAFTALWAVPFIQRAFSVSTEEAGFAVSMSYIGWMFGGPLIGFASSYFKRRKPLLVLGGFLGGACLLPILYVDSLPMISVFVLFFFVGFFSSAQLLTFSHAIMTNPIEYKGTAVAFTNFLVMSGGLLMQPLAGSIIDWEAGVSALHDIQAYPINSLQDAFFLFPLFFFLASFLSLFLHESGNSR